jgi:hypothetical protein
MGDEREVKLLLARNDIDVNWTNARGVTCLMLAASMGEENVTREKKEGRQPFVKSVVFSPKHCTAGWGFTNI